jgi:ABC-type glutathione transport system ATPase component
MAQVHLRGVKKTYDNKVEVIHGIDMEIADGEFIVIVGPSGCGKSTLLRMVAGLERITGGEVAIGDRVVNELEPKDRDIAMVFQNYALYPHMSVYQNMAYGLKIKGMPKDEIERRVQKAAKILELGTVPAAPAAPALGRPAPARRHGPRHRARARRCSCSTSRSATSTPSCACRCGSRSSAAARARRHLDLRDARPGRGDDPGRPA